jgi:hypothetical protein
LFAIGKGKGVLLAGKEAATSISVLLVPGEVGVEAKEGHVEEREEREEGFRKQSTEDCASRRLPTQSLAIDTSNGRWARGMRSWERMRRRYRNNDDAAGGQLDSSTPSLSLDETVMT